MPTFEQRWSPVIPLLVNPKDPSEPAADASSQILSAVMPKDTADEFDYGHLISGKPQPSQVAGEGVAPSKSNQAGEDNYAHLITGKPEPPKQAEPPEPPPEPDLSGGFGIVAKGFQKAPLATAAIGAPLALGTSIPIAGLGAMGMSALPLWAQLLTAYGVGSAIHEGIGGLAGAPGTAKAVGSLMDLITRSGEAVAP